MDRQSAGDISGSKTTLCDAMMLDTCRDTFIQAHTMYNTMSDPLIYTMGSDVGKGDGSVGNLCTFLSSLL